MKGQLKKNQAAQCVLPTQDDKIPYEALVQENISLRKENKGRKDLVGQREQDIVGKDHLVGE